MLDTLNQPSMNFCTRMHEALPNELLDVISTFTNEERCNIAMELQELQKTFLNSIDTIAYLSSCYIDQAAITSKS